MATISVIVGSTRQGRFCKSRRSGFFSSFRSGWCRSAAARPSRLSNAFFDQPVPPAMPGRAPYEHEVVKRWTAEIAASDGFVFVTPEYNYGPRRC